MKVKYLKYIPLQAMIEAGLNPNEMLFCSILMSFTKDNMRLASIWLIFFGKIDPNINKIISLKFLK